MTRNLPPQPGPPNAEIRLRVLHTSDLHGALRGYDYLADKPSDTFGLTRTATLIREARRTSANALLFDTGDFLQGSPICDLAAKRGLSPGVVHPIVAAMNALRYDAVALGNHDFNHGADFLLRSLEDARFPVVSANITGVGPGTKKRQVFAPYTVLTRSLTDTKGRSHDLRIGVIGCLPPQTTDWDHALSPEFATECMIAASRIAAARLAAENCDLTVLLAHTGIDTEAPAERPENALIELASLDGIDLLLGGHTHRVFPAPPAKAPAHDAVDAAMGTIWGKPVLMSGFGGNHLGQADLTLAQAPSGSWALKESNCSLLPVARRDALGHVASITPEDPKLKSVTQRVHAETLRYIREPVGEARMAFHSFFSLLTNDAAIQLVARAKADFVREALADGPLAGLPLLSAVAPFKTGRLGGPDYYTHCPAGPLSRRSITDLYAYPNSICAVRVSGAQLRDWLEHSACLFSHFPAESVPDTPLLEEGVPGYRFDVICGPTYEIDLIQPPRFGIHGHLVNPDAERIRNLRIGNAPARDDQSFIVATNSYRVYGTGFASPRPEVVFEAPVTCRDIVLDHVKKASPIDTKVTRVWSFTPLGGATAIFETSPLARAYLGDPWLPPLEDLGNTAEGFARFRVTL